MSPHRTILATTVAVLFCSSAAAQLGASSGLSFDAKSAVSRALGGTWAIHGVVRTVGSTYWLSARRSAPTPLTRMIEFTEAGVYLRSVDLPAALSGSATGFLDLAYDAAGGAIYGSCEHAVAGRQLWAFRILNRVFDTSSNVPVPVNAPGTTVRGLAYDRFGDGGRGSFLCVDGNSAITEFDRSGGLRRFLTNPHPNATALAIDDSRRLLWVFGPGGSSRTSAGVVGIALDLVTGISNGQYVLGDADLLGNPPGGNVTGAEFSDYEHDHTVYRLVLATSALSDHVYEMGGRFAFGARCGGHIGFTGDAAYAGNAAWAVTLDGSTATAAFLLVAGASDSTPIGGPVFDVNCQIHLALGTPPILLGGANVSAGRAQLGVPIPSGVSGEVYFQWIEATGGPLRSSDGGGVFVRP